MRILVKKKELNFTINKNHNFPCFAYNYISGNITIPNLRPFANFCKLPKYLNIPETFLDFKLLIRCLNHDFIHKWIHEEINLEGCIKWDLIDKDSNGHLVLT